MSSLTPVERALLRLVQAARTAEINWSTVYTADPGAIATALDALYEAGINPNTGEKLPSLWPQGGAE